MKVLKKKEKQAIKEEKIKQFNTIFENVKGNKRTLIDGLIEQACFAYVQLKELNEIIEKNGVVEKFKQGKQQFNREQPAMKSYNSLLKNYNAVIKELSEFLPPGNAIPTEDEFTRYKQNRNK